MLDTSGLHTLNDLDKRSIREFRKMELTYEITHALKQGIRVANRMGYPNGERNFNIIMDLHAGITTTAVAKKYGLTGPRTAQIMNKQLHKAMHGARWPNGVWRQFMKEIKLERLVYS